MDFRTLATVAAAMCLAACAATSTDNRSSTESDDLSADGSADGGASIDGGDADATATDAGPAVATYAEEAPVIQQRCGSCHGTKFSTLAKVAQDRASMVQELQEQKMPKDNPAWATSADGKTLLNFLESSPELN